MSRFSTSREIGIDAGHRIPDHESKCKSIHGHRYRVLAEVVGTLATEGSERGMTMDFGFIKEIMMEHVDKPCDHGLILSIHDPLLTVFLPTFDVENFHKGYYEGDGVAGKLYLIPYVPTAENLARHWYERMHPAILMRSNSRAVLKQVTVFETPFCVARYPVPE